MSTPAPTPAPACGVSIPDQIAALNGQNVILYRIGEGCAVTIHGRLRPARGTPVKGQTWWVVDATQSGQCLTADVMFEVSCVERLNGNTIDLRA